MNVTLDLEKDLKEQFQSLIDSESFDAASGYAMEKIKRVEFPDQMAFYYFAPVEHKIPIHMTSINAKESEWYLVHMNIGGDMHLKQMENQPSEYQRFVPSGVLLYCPGVVVKTNFSEGHRSELATIRFPKRLIHSYYDDSFIQDGQLLVYEDLEYGIEKKIRAALKVMDNKLKCHTIVLEIIEHLFHNIKSNASQSKVIALHNDDIQNLLAASEFLKNPLSPTIPSIGELAKIAKMSPSKFKACFKQFFGRAPHQFHFNIKMEYARNELKQGRKTPVELSHELEYSHPSNFTSAYKNYFNVVPSSDFVKG
ncbi:MAG: AraC family transcriptional regulator [Bacteroidota bacterium]